MLLRFHELFTNFREDYENRRHIRFLKYFDPIVQCSHWTSFFYSSWNLIRFMISVIFVKEMKVWVYFDFGENKATKYCTNFFFTLSRKSWGLIRGYLKIFLTTWVPVPVDSLYEYKINSYCLFWIPPPSSLKSRRRLWMVPKLKTSIYFVL